MPEFAVGFFCGLSAYFPPLALALPVYLRILVKASKRGKFLFGLGFSLGVFLPAFRAFHLTVGNLYLSLLTFGVAVFSFALLQFFLPSLFEKPLRSYALPFFLVELLRSHLLFNGFPYFHLSDGFLQLFPQGVKLLSPTLWDFLLLSPVEFFALKKLSEFGMLLSLVAVILSVSTFGVNSAKVNVKGAFSVVQPFLSWEDKEKHQEFLKLYSTLLATETQKPLVFFPETTFNTLSFDLREFSETFPKKTFVVGAKFWEFGGEKVRLYNAAIFLKSGEVLGIYRKVKPLPFGEYTPEGFGFLAKLVPYLGGVDYSAGKGFKVFNLRGLKIFPLICNEVFFLPDPKGADLVVVLANTWWFSEPFKNLQRLYAKLEAIRYGVPVLFVNNAGGSALFLPNGEVEECGKGRVCNLEINPKE